MSSNSVRVRVFVYFLYTALCKKKYRTQFVRFFSGTCCIFIARTIFTIFVLILSFKRKMFCIFHFTACLQIFFVFFLGHAAYTAVYSNVQFYTSIYYYLHLRFQCLKKFFSILSS